MNIDHDTSTNIKDEKGGGIRSDPVMVTAASQVCLSHRCKHEHDTFRECMAGKGEI